MKKIKIKKIYIICVAAIFVIIIGGIGIYKYNKDSSIDKTIKAAEDLTKISKEDSQKKIEECKNKCIEPNIQNANEAVKNKEEQTKKKQEYKTYENGRFGFKVNYPSNWTNLKYPDNGDGCLLYDDGINKVISSASHKTLQYEEYLSLKADNVEAIQNFTTNSGEKGKIVIGRKDENHIFGLLLDKDGVIFNLDCISTDDFYNTNKEVLYEMAKSYQILDHGVDR